MTDETVTEVLPTAALTAALYALWLNTARERVREAAEATYSLDGEYERALRLGRYFAVLDLLIPTCVVAILSPVAWTVVSSINVAHPYSATSALFLLVFVLWIGATALGAIDIGRVVQNGRAIGRAKHAEEALRRKTDPGAGSAAGS